MRYLLISLVWLALGSAGAQDVAQTTEQWGLEHLCAHLGLKPDDIGFRADYTEPDSFRLAVITELMEKPLGMIEYAASLSSAQVSGQPEILAGILLSDLRLANQPARGRPYQPTAAELQQPYNLYYTNLNLNQLLTRASIYLNTIIPKSAAVSLQALTDRQRQFLRDEFKELLVTRVDEEFMSPQEIDSMENAEEQYTETFVEYGYLIDPDPIVAAGIDCLREMMGGVRALQSELGQKQTTIENIVEGVGYLPDNTDWQQYLGKQSGWAVGGGGNDYYRGDYRFIIDLGGDDIYDLDYDPAHPHGVIIIDLAGDDVYRGRSDFALGSGCFSVGLLLDLDGNDTYRGRSFSLGSGYFGLGVLYDAAGNDMYDGDTHVQAAGTYGLGLLVDEGGRDIYNAALYAQGFGFVHGIGVIQDADGADSYYAGGKYKDILRYEDHFLSLSQGFGYGLRPWMSGGIGAIIDHQGNDSYYSDIFAQATSYWWSLGVIYDSSGNDNYQSFQYAQGAATHMSLGVLIDDWGHDVYFGKGLMHGCGHDYSCGLILDRHGNDTYTAFDLSQGAGSANGAGILIDNEGDDRYFVQTDRNTQGYGNPRRDFGSIGLFIDLGGSDQYWGNGCDNYYWRTDSKWGGGMDIEMNLPDTTREDQP
ncbi:MAG: hypothetical protein ABIE70_08530 [bacterium]